MKIARDHALCRYAGVLITFVMITAINGPRRSRRAALFDASAASSRGGREVDEGAARAAEFGAVGEAREHDTGRDDEVFVGEAEVEALG